MRVVPVCTTGHISGMERRTRQREVIRRVFEETARPLGPAEVLDAGRTKIRGLGIATVYRAIHAMVESGWLVPVQLPGEAARYERAGTGHHHHFRCKGCSRVFEVEGCPEGFSGLMPSGFTLEEHEVVLYGRCPECARC